MAQIFRKVAGSPAVHRVFLTLLVFVGGSTAIAGGCS